MDKQTFKQLCDLSGVAYIGPEGSGPEHGITEASQKALLAVWGLSSTDAASLDRALDQLYRDRWLQLINPVLVAEEKSGPLCFDLRLPEAMLRHPLQWHITEENGVSTEGEAIADALEMMSESQLDGARYVGLRLTLDLPDHPLPIGYHYLRVAITDGKDRRLNGQCTLIITPKSCYTPPGLSQEARIWGLSCDLDTIRSKRNWGIGDLTDLQHILCWAAENGAATVAVSSLLTRLLPRKDSLQPALPSSRCFLNPLFLDLEVVADFSESEEVRGLVFDPAFQVRLAKLRDTHQVEYEEVAALKTVVSEALWHHFQLNHLNPETERGWSFRHFQQTGGRPLQAFALYEAMREEFRTGTHETGEAFVLPEALPDPSSPEAADFVHSHQERIAFHQYLQWQLKLQLAEVGKRSMELGLKVGLTLTLPAGDDPHGFAVWSQPSLFGTPPRVPEQSEDCSPSGPPMLPALLAETAYEPFIAMLRFNMHYAGALRLKAIDMLEGRQGTEAKNIESPGVWIPPRTQDLLGIIALESRRNRCLVIGDHRAPLSETLTRELHDRGILVHSSGFFEMEQQDGWPAPSAYPGPSVVMASRYDLCSLANLWQGRDIALLSTRCPCFDTQAQERAVITRAAARAHLLVALKRENLLPPGYGIDPAGVAFMTPALIRALYAFLTRTPAKIFLVHVVDLPVESDQDTTTEPMVLPLWQQKVPVELESMAADEQIQHLFREFCQDRTMGVVRPSARLADRRKRQGYTIPRSFYRLQFNGKFTFLQAAAIVPYLKELAISHCYASPYLKARPGSSHGYDIIDHGALNPEIGSREEYEEYVAALDSNGIAQILDMVPNHMGVGPDNSWWVDVLENGQASPYADFFDINWQSQEEELKNRILLPVLGDYSGIVLEQGLLRLVFLPAQGCFFISYYEHFYPVAPRTYPHILGHDLPRLETRLGGNHEGFLELQSLIASFANLPGREETGQERMEMRNRDKEVLKRLLARLCRETPEIALFIEENVIYYNGEPGRPESFDPLERLLALQAYRLAFWRVASDEINYRRFFDINDLAGIRMEHKAVFDATHAFVLDLIATGKIDGLRIDHPDGLYDPESYFRNLQAAVSDGTPEQWPIPEHKLSVRDRQASLPLYVVVEKILADFEQLPRDWMVHGTSGYDFSCLLNGLFIDQSAEETMTAIYHEFIGRRIDFSLLVHSCKRLIIKTAMAGEINVLSDQLHRLAKQNRYTRDYTLNGLRAALTEIVAFFPVYRTYFPSEAITASNRQYVELAVNRAKAQQLADDTSIYDFIHAVLLLETPRQGGLQKQESIDFIMKFQQYTGPIMAKGLEDTAFYIYNRLLSLNEVGGDPCRFGVSLSAFHAANRERADHWPHAMLNTSTHDSKRSEDVRARINVLSEMPTRWQGALARWQGLNRAKKTMVRQETAPSKNDEYALYQNLLGVWPLEEMTGEQQDLFQARFAAYMLKVIREAKVHTSWLNPDQAYEEAMTGFIEKLLNDKDGAFLDDFISFQQKISRFGMINSLAQLLLKLTAPGVPDIYQGNEIWHFCLVDPDNRRPVDFDKRMALLAELQRSLEEDASRPLAERVHALLLHPADGRVKMYCLWKALTYRRENPELFQQGGYIPLPAAGTGSAHVCAFARMHGEQTLIVAVPRLVARLLQQDADRLPLGPEVWTDTIVPLPGPHLNHKTFTNMLTGEEITDRGNGNGIAVADLFARFPFALLAER